jgi:hypothetical protein
MFNRLPALCFVLALSSAELCFAQDVEPATSAEIATARAYADQLIRTGNASAHFENMTTDATPKVRHKASGLTCSFSDERYDRIFILPAQGGLTEGDDVGCNTRLLDVDFSFYATRYARRFEAQFVLEDAMRAIAQRWPQGKLHVGDLMTASSGEGPAPLIAGYDIDVDGHPHLTLVLVSHSDEWSFKGRVTGPAGDETPTNMLGAVVFLTALPESATQ